MLTRRNLLAGAASLGLAGATGVMAQTVEMVGQGLRLKTTDFAADRATFQTRLLRHKPAPQPPRSLPKPPADVEEITYDSNGLALKAWVGKPDQSAGKLPVVIFLHGGFAFGLGDYDMARPFVAAGYAIVTPILRAENGQPGDFSLFYGEVDDVLAAAAHVATLPWVDPAHIYLAGHSVGGTLSMLAGQASNIFRAVVSFSGSPDQIAFTTGERSLIPFDRNDKIEFEMRSPMAYARSFKSPTRLYCGSQEGFFLTSTPQTAALAKKAGLDVEAITVPGDHFSAVPQEIALTVAFFQANA